VMGKEDYLKKLFFASIDVKIIRDTEDNLTILFKNNSSLDLI